MSQDPPSLIYMTLWGYSIQSQVWQPMSDGFSNSMESFINRVFDPLGYKSLEDKYSEFAISSGKVVDDGSGNTELSRNIPKNYVYLVRMPDCPIPLQV